MIRVRVRVRDRDGIRVDCNLRTVRYRVDRASLWKQMIMAQGGKSLGYTCDLHLDQFMLK